MDLELGVYFRLARFGLPAGVSLALLVWLWWTGELYGGGLVFVCGWFLAASAAQLLTTNVLVWAAGLAAHTLLAIVLILKARLSEMS
jgi:hypothetical protein